MIVETLQEAERVLTERWNAKSYRERREIERRYEAMKRGRKVWKKELKPLFDKILGDNTPCA
jgi:FtsZ-binding cell division protein ZapB